MDSVCVCVYYVLCKCAAGCTISTTIICLHSAFVACNKSLGGELGAHVLLYGVAEVSASSRALLRSLLRRDWVASAAKPYLLRRGVVGMGK